MENNHALVIGYAFSDGAGDFSAVSKMIQTLLSMKFRRENIVSVMIEPDISAHFHRFISEYIDKTATNIESLNLMQLKNLYGDFSIGVTQELVDDINQILFTTCKALNTTHLDSEIDCDRKQLPSGKIPHELTNAELIQAYNKVTVYIHNLITERSKYHDKPHPVIYEEVSKLKERVTPEELPTARRELISNMWKQINKNPIGEIKYSMYRQFISSFIVDYVVNWKSNYEQFFIKSNLLPRGNLHVFTSKEWNNIPLAAVNINKDKVDNLVVLSFYYDRAVNTEVDALLDRHIKLSEGGNCTFKKSYSTGFSTEHSTCIGLNTVDRSVIKEDPNEYMNMDEPFHLCYLGQGTHNITQVTLLAIYKLRAFCNLLWKKYVESRVVYLNDIYFMFIMNNIRICSFIFGDPIEKLDDRSFKVLGHIFRRYKRLTNSQFIYALNKSADLCILSGDQSAYEGISLGKNVVYDLHVHKKELYVQLFKLYKFYLETNTEIPSEITNDLSKRQEISMKSISRQLDLSFRDFNTSSYWVPDSIFNTLTEIKEFKSGEEQKMELIFDDIGKKVFTLTSSGFEGKSKLKSSTVDCKELYPLYEVFMEISDLALKNKEKFIEWINSKYNVDVNLTHLIEQLFTPPVEPEPISVTPLVEYDFQESKQE